MLNNIRIDLKMLFRVPLSIFFTLIFPIIIMLIMVISYGNIEIGDGAKLIDKYMLITIGMGIAPLTLISLPLWIGNSSDQNYLKRLIYLHVDLKKIIISNIIAHFIIGLLGIVINIIVAYTLFGLKFPSVQYFLSYFLQVSLCLLIMMLVGAVLGFTIKNSQILMPLGLVLTFIVYMFSGAFVDYSQLPEMFIQISNYIPLKYIMNDSFNTWVQKNIWPEGYILICLAYFIFTVILLYFSFRKWMKFKVYKKGDSVHE